MSLRYAILTGLNERPATGIELTRRFDRSIGYFWPASHQQVYRDLERLEADGLVNKVSQDGPLQHGRPQRYCISEAGRVALIAWVQAVDEPTATRNALLVKVRAAASIGPAHVRNVIAHHLAAHERALNTYRLIEQRDFSPAPAEPAAALQHLVLKRGIETEASAVNWCREVLAVVQAVTP